MEEYNQRTAEADWLPPAEEERLNATIEASIGGLIKSYDEVNLLHIDPTVKLIIQSYLDATMKSLMNACARLDLRTSPSGNITSALKSLTEARYRIENYFGIPNEAEVVEPNLNADIDGGDSPNDSSKLTGEDIPINIMDLPGEIRNQIYSHIFGVYHIHMMNLTTRANLFNMESMNGLLIESLRFHLESADAGLVSDRAPFHHGYWHPDDLHHRICQRAKDSFPAYECCGKCLHLSRNDLTLSLAVLRTCRAIYEEARLLPYRLNSFEFTESNLLDFMRTRSPDQISAIKRVKFVASMERCRINEKLTHWVSGILQRSCLFKNLTSIMLSAKYVAVGEGQVWADGFLMTTQWGLCCQVVLGQKEPGVGKLWWGASYFDGEFGIMRAAPNTKQKEPLFVNLLPSA